MAIQGSITFGNGITLASAYLVVNEVYISYKLNDNYVNVNVLIYKDSTAYTSGKPEVLALTHKCSDGDFTTYFDESVLTVAGNTSLTQAYDWLKTLSQYSSWTEV